jgi:two-component system nitrogen regulation sensor histidine kinase GlnL
MSSKATSPRKAEIAAAASAAPVNPVDYESLLSALPHPILIISEEQTIVFANVAAESFYSMSASALMRCHIADILAFGCPLIAFIEQVQATGSTVNEYGIEVATPRFASAKLVDVYGGPLPEKPRHMFLML